MRYKTSRLTNRIVIVLIVLISLKLLSSTVVNSSHIPSGDKRREVNESLITSEHTIASLGEPIFAADEYFHYYTVHKTMGKEGFRDKRSFFPFFFRNPFVYHNPVLLKSDFASFSSRPLSAGINPPQGPTIMTLVNTKRYTLFGKNIFDIQDLEFDGEVHGIFGLFDDTVQDRIQFPRVYMVNILFGIERIEQQFPWLNNDRLYLSFQGLETMSGTADSLGDDSLKMDWLVEGQLVSARRQIELVNFSFKGALSHHPHFYISDFQAQATSSAITVEQTINSDKNIVITIEETVSLNVLFGFILSLFTLIILGFRAKSIKRLIVRFLSD